tara:strand:- start:289 stop:858 length:570 start_codon:yes stop_codon:yes gene_type:complete
MLKNDKTIELEDNKLDNIKYYLDYKTKRDNLDKEINSKKIEYEKNLNEDRERIIDEINKLTYSTDWEEKYDKIQKNKDINKELKIIISKMKKKMKIRLPDKKLIDLLRNYEFEEYFNKQETQIKDKITELIFDLFKNNYNNMNDYHKEIIENICLEKLKTLENFNEETLDKCKNNDTTIEINKILIKYL